MLTLFHDPVRPASTVAAERVLRLADEGLPARVVGFAAIGVDLRLPVTDDVAAEATALAAEAAAEGLTLRPPPALPPTERCHLVGDLASAQGLARPWWRAAHRALWTHGRDLADAEVLAELAASVGCVGAEATLVDRAALAAMRRRTAQLRAEGVGDAPVLEAHHTLVPGLLGEDDLRALAR